MLFGTRFWSQPSKTWNAIVSDGFSEIRKWTYLDWQTPTASDSGCFKLSNCSLATPTIILHPTADCKRVSWSLDEANTVSHTILDLSRSKVDMRSQVWEGFKQIGWKPVYFRHFDVQKKSFRSQIPHFTSKIFLLFKKFGFSSPNSIFINSTPATSVTIHPRHFKLFFARQSVSTIPVLQEFAIGVLVFDISGPFCSSVHVPRFERNHNATSTDPDRTAEHPTTELCKLVSHLLSFSVGLTAQQWFSGSDEA